MKGTRLEDSFRHGLRVRVGPRRDRGVLLHCEKRDGGGKYWRVRLQSGEWVWPDHSLVLDGPGENVAVCEQCFLPFLTVKTGDGLLCARCDVEQFGGAARGSEPSSPRRWNSRRRWRP